MIFDIKEIPYLQKGSGVMYFKSKNFKLHNFCCIDNSFTLNDIDAKKIELGDLKPFLTKRGKAGKIIKIKKDLLLSKGFSGYYKFN